MILDILSVQQEQENAEIIQPWEYEAPLPEYANWEVEQFLENTREMYDLSPSQFVEQAIMVASPKTKMVGNFSFAERPYLKAIYNSKASRKLLLAGRQVEKSSTIGNYMLAMSCLIPRFRSLYVSPSSMQSKEFSKARLKETIDTCPVIRTWFPADLTDNVFEKKAINRSDIKLRYAFLNADRTRGISSDLICLDEFQLFYLSTIPAIEETAFHSAYKYFIYSGTPLSLDNPIQHYWDQFSTQNEWAIPCKRHGTPKVPGSWHWNILSEDSIGDEGLICDKKNCRHRIYASDPDCQWTRTGTPDPKYTQYEGFHIPQLMVPWVDWGDIKHKYHTYPRANFFNEVMGQSFDSGQRPLTREDVMKCCDPHQSMTGEWVQEFLQKIQGQKIWAGIDWGQGSTNSYTVLCLGTYHESIFNIFYLHRFEGEESETKAQMTKIMRLVDTLKIHRIGVDFGGGHWPNEELMKKYGVQRVCRFQYTNPSTYMQFNSKLGYWIIHRSEIMSKMFNCIKRGTVFRFPKWAEFQTPFAADMLSIFSEYSERNRMTMYNKSPNTTDDTFHAITMCFLASMIDQPREDIFVPGAAIDRMGLE